MALTQCYTITQVNISILKAWFLVSSKPLSKWGRREVAWFVLLNVVGLGFSVVCLLVSHDLLHLTSRLADNVSANGVGLLLGTVFRFWTYRLLVFREDAGPAVVGAGDPRRQSGGRQVEPGTIAS